MRTRTTSWVWATMTALPLVLAGCGGSTEIAPSPSQGGSAGAGGAVGGSGGSTASGGSSGTGGSATGGTGGNGGTAGAGATAGSAGAGGSVPGWASCAGPGACIKQYNGCCPACGLEKITDSSGVNRDPKQVEIFRASQCSTPNPPCPDCINQVDPNLTSFCVAQQCQMIDVRTDDVSTCSNDSDCMIRYADCCEQCGGPYPELLIALNKQQAGSYQGQVCGAETGCPPCVPVYPADYVAICGADKHCKVAQPQAPLGCPVQPPTTSACMQDGLACEWGQDIRIVCREQMTCQAGQWQLPPAPICPPLPGPGMAGCPTNMAATGSACAGLEGTICEMDSGGDMCVCDPCGGGGPCSQYGRWFCVGPVSSACPVIAPENGQKCAMPGLSCVYGVCGTVTSAARQCGSNGTWLDTPVACPN
jgi:hypothetical protein